MIKFISTNKEGYLGACEVVDELYAESSWKKAETERDLTDWDFIDSHPFSHYVNGRVEQDTEALAKAKTKREAQAEIVALKTYLNDTDYVISKLNELKLEADDEEYESARQEYAEVLAKRKEARKRINGLEAQGAK